MPGHPRGILSGARQDTVDRIGSPEYPYAPGAISAGASDTISPHVQFPAAQKYAPLDTVQIVNNSTEQLLISVNGQPTGRTVPGGTIATISNQPIITFRITNEDGSAATGAGEINCNFSRAPLSADELARRFRR